MLRHLALLATLPPTLQTTQGANACATAMDCSLNGLCQHDGACACDPGWTGSDCGVLNLGPTPDNAIGSGRIYPPIASNTSSWGGGVVFRGGKYHLYVSEMAGRCGLATWTTNSFIRHAVSDTVDGIYTPQDTVMESWSHNAMPWVTPEGDIAVWHIGNGVQLRPKKAGCVNGTTPLPPLGSGGGSGNVEEGSAPAAVIGTPGPVLQIPYSPSAHGPWQMMNLTCNGNSSAGPEVCVIDNPTPVSFPNGTTLLAHRARRGFGVLVAPHWGGPYRNVVEGWDLNATNVLTPDDEAHGCEDGFLFLGQRGGVHLLCHCNGVSGYPWDDHGRHAFSRDGVEWRWSRERTFPPAFIHPDGTNTTHISRQRPQLLFGAGRVPTQLISGISVSSTNRVLPWQAGCTQLGSVSRPCDLTCTSMQPVLA